MDMLNIHMRHVHQELEHEKLTRVTATVKSAKTKPSEPGTGKSFNCTECGEVFANIDQHNIHNKEQHGELNNHQQEKHSTEEDANCFEEYEIKEYPENKETEEDTLLDTIFGTKKKEKEQEGITMKGKSVAFKDACVIVKSKLTKGRVLKDKKGRQIKILTEKSDGVLDVEVQTLSKKFNEKRGQARLHMYKPSKMRKKGMLHSNIKISRS